MTYHDDQHDVHRILLCSTEYHIHSEPSTQPTMNKHIGPRFDMDCIPGRGPGGVFLAVMDYTIDYSNHNNALTNSVFCSLGHFLVREALWSFG